MITHTLTNAQHGRPYQLLNYIDNRDNEKTIGLKLGMATNRDFDIRIFGHPFERIFEYSTGNHSMVYRCLKQPLPRENTVVLNVQYQQTLMFLIRREYVHYVLNSLDVCF